MSGPIAGADCATCNHPQVAEINAMFAEGRLSGRRIDDIFGLARGSVSRHVHRHHPGAPPARNGAVKAAPSSPGRLGETGPTEVDRLIVLRRQLEDDMAARPRSDTARELRQVNQRIAEISGEARPKQVSVADVAGLRDQVARWFEALEPYPEARAAMAAATDLKLLPETGPDD
jgi:hypothetical protein